MGCQKPQAFDPPSEDELPKPDEEFEPIEKLTLNLEFEIAPEEADGQSLDVMKKNIENDLAAVYDTMNPFEEAITEVVVTIEQICTKEGEDSFSIAEGVSCEELASKRKRRNIFNDIKDTATSKETYTDLLDDAQDLGEQGWDKTKELAIWTKDTTVYASVSFYSTVKNQVIPWTLENAEKFYRQAEEIAVKMIHTVVKFANDVISYIIGNICKAGKIGRIVGEGLNNLRNNANAKLAVKGVTKVKPDMLNHHRDFVFGLRNWMDSLPDKIKKLPLTQIAIPGSHRSSTYRLLPFTPFPFAPDSLLFQQLEDHKMAHALASAVGHKYGFMNFTMAWSQTINITTFQQLELGLRYFDYR